MTLKTEHQLRVEDMMLKIRERTNYPSLPDSPTIPSDFLLMKQARLVMEEFLELMDACGLRVTCELDSGELGLKKKRDVISMELPHIAKELVDVSVVVTGLMSEFGLKDKPLLEAVDNANLRKFGPGSYVDERGKLRKPKDFQDVNMSECLKNQGWKENSHEEDETVLLQGRTNDFQGCEEKAPGGS